VTTTTTTSLKSISIPLFSAVAVAATVFTFAGKVYKSMDDEQDDLRTRLTIMETQVSVAQHRVDRIENRLDSLQNWLDSKFTAQAEQIQQAIREASK